MSDQEQPPPSQPSRDEPSVTTPLETCDYCGSTDLWWRNCKLLCRNCQGIVKSCGDL